MRKAAEQTPSNFELMAALSVTFLTSLPDFCSEVNLGPDILPTPDFMALWPHFR